MTDQTAGEAPDLTHLTRYVIRVHGDTRTVAAALAVKGGEPA